MHSDWYRRPRNWILLVLAVIFIWGGLRFWSSRSEYSARIAKLQAAGIPTNTAELNDFYAVPEGVRDTTELWVAALDSVDEDAIKDVRESLPYIGVSDPPKPEDEWPEFEQARAFLSAQNDTMDAIRRAMDVGGAVRFDVDFSPGINTLLPRTQDCRNLMRLLRLDCQVAYREDDFDRIHSNLLGMLRLSGILRAEPTMISQLFGNALYAMACSDTAEYVGLCGWNNEQLRQLQEQAAELDARAALQVGLIGGQVNVLHIFEQVPVIDTLGGAIKPDVLEYFEQAVNVDDLPWHECLQKQFAVSAKFQKRSEESVDLVSRLDVGNRLGLIMFSLRLPADDRFTASMARMEAKRRCLVGLLAMARLRAAGDELPDSLDELTDNVLPTSGTPFRWADPFDGQPLKILRTDDSLTIYSIGEDQTDNVGLLEPPPGVRSYDVGFRLAL